MRGQMSVRSDFIGNGEILSGEMRGADGLGMD